MDTAYRRKAIRGDQGRKQAASRCNFQTNFYYLDLLKYRPISNKIAEDFNVHHQSPQILVIKNGECTYEESHNGIDMHDIAEQLA